MVDRYDRYWLVWILIDMIDTYTCFLFCFVGSTKLALANSDDLQVMLEDRS